MTELEPQPHLRRGLGVAAFGLIGTLLVSGCGNSPEVTEGTVIDKSHRAAYTVLVPFRSCVRSGKSNICTTTLIPVSHPESWDVTVENCAIKPEDQDACPQRTLHVPREKYDQVQVGDAYHLSAEELGQFLVAQTTGELISAAVSPITSGTTQ